jgi:BCD family chlorophyll transporter-like MFS transporter
VLRAGVLTDANAFGTVFIIEAALFLAAAAMAHRIMDRPAPAPQAHLVPGE